MKHRLRGRSDIGRALLACLVLAALFGLAITLGSGSRQAAQTASLPPAQGDDELTTGSIVFVPVLGSRCHKKLIDNATWHIVDAGDVDCSTALSQSASGPSRWSAARVDVIRKGFRKQ